MKAVIIGNSAAGLAAVKAFRKYDKTSELILISKEGGNAYSRVLLPYVLRGKLPYEGLFIRDDKFYTENNINYIEDEVTGIDTKENLVMLKGQDDLNYDKLLIATGSYAAAPPIPGIKEEGVFHMWTKADVDGLLPLFETKKKVVVIGSGFVALQAAWSAKFRGLDVEIIEIADRIMPSVLDEQGGNVLAKQIVETGVTLHTSTVTEKIEKQEDGSFIINVKDKEAIKADFIIVGTGVRSNTEFLEGTDVKNDRGIFVDEYMKTNIENIYSAGDVAKGITAFGESMVHALWPTAIEMGDVAGMNMAGKAIAYEGSLNMNVTQMYDVTVASMGKFADGDIDESYVFEVEANKGYLKVCYKDELIVGACLVGSSDAVKLFGKLRPLIKKKTKVECQATKLESYLNIKIFQDRN